MINDLLSNLSELCTNGYINSSEYTLIYEILMGAKDRQNKSTFEELAKNLSECYKDKLVHDHIGEYHCFGYPKFEAKVDRICLYFKPYYVYCKGIDKIESRFKNYNYTTIQKDEINTRIEPITLEEMKEMLNTFEGIDVEYVLNKFRDDPRRKNVVD